MNGRSPYKDGLVKNFFENPKEFQVELMKLHFSWNEIAVPKVIKNLI